MPKKAIRKDKFEGGLNTNSDPKDIEPNQLVKAQNIDISKKGSLQPIGRFQSVDNIIPTGGKMNGNEGYGFFKYSSDYSFLNAGPSDSGTDAELNLTATVAQQGQNASKARWRLEFSSSGYFTAPMQNAGNSVYGGIFHPTDKVTGRSSTMGADDGGDASNNSDWTSNTDGESDVAATLTDGSTDFSSSFINGQSLKIEVPYNASDRISRVMLKESENTFTAPTDDATVRITFRMKIGVLLGTDVSVTVGPSDGTGVVGDDSGNGTADYDHWAYYYKKANSLQGSNDEMATGLQGFDLAVDYIDVDQVVQWKSNFDQYTIRIDAKSALIYVGDFKIQELNPLLTPSATTNLIDTTGSQISVDADGYVPQFIGPEVFDPWNIGKVSPGGGAQILPKAQLSSAEIEPELFNDDISLNQYVQALVDVAVNNSGTNSIFSTTNITTDAGWGIIYEAASAGALTNDILWTHNHPLTGKGIVGLNHFDFFAMQMNTGSALQTHVVKLTYSGSSFANQGMNSFARINATTKTFATGATSTLAAMQAALISEINTDAIDDGSGSTNQTYTCNDTGSGATGFTAVTDDNASAYLFNDGTGVVSVFGCDAWINSTRPTLQEDEIIAFTTSSTDDDTKAHLKFWSERTETWNSNFGFQIWTTTTGNGAKTNFYADGNALRLSDGNFNNTGNKAKYFGPIQRTTLFKAENQSSNQDTHGFTIMDKFVLQDLAPHFNNASGTTLTITNDGSTDPGISDRCFSLATADGFGVGTSGDVIQDDGVVQFIIVRNAKSIAGGQAVDSGTWNSNYKFYLSQVFNDGQESLLTHIFKPVATGNDSEILVLDGTDTHTNVSICVGAIFNLTTSYIWDPRAEGLALYYSASEDHHAEKWYMGMVDFSRGWVAVDGSVTGWSTTVDHEHMKIGGSNNATYANTNPALNTSNFDNFVGTGAVEIVDPPSSITYEMRTGYSEFNHSLEAKWKTSCTLGRRTVIGNIGYPDASGTYHYFNDRMIASPVNGLDTFPTPDNVMDVNISDGDAIVRLESFGQQILQFKTNIMYIIDMSGEDLAAAYVAETHPYKGILHHNAVVKTAHGIFWFNKTGAYMFDGEVKNVLQISTEDSGPGTRRISTTDWSSFIGDYSICGYDPNEDMIIIVKSSKYIDSTSYDTYNYNIGLDAWTTSKGKLVTTTTGNDLSNFVNTPQGDLMIATEGIRTPELDTQDNT